MRRQKSGFGVVILLIGILLLSYPDIMNFRAMLQNKRVITQFDENTEKNVSEQTELSAQEEGEACSGMAESAYYQECLAYNEELYRDGQSDLVDAWSYGQISIPVDTDDVFGYIEIPAMSLEMPLYLGASEEHMDLGAAVLGQTSIPIGGTNTNSVIAGHRGWYKGDYFLEIEKLGLGDLVYITNPWETLTYQVTEIRIIEPDDRESILIREGCDMVTLITCHPYGSHGRYRYLVYCEREKTTSDETLKEPGKETAVDLENFPPDAEAEADDRRTEYGKWVRRCSVIAGIILILVSLISGRKRKG